MSRFDARYRWVLPSAVVAGAWMSLALTAEAGRMAWHPDNNRWEDTWEGRPQFGYSGVNLDGLSTAEATLAILNASLFPGEEPIRHFHVFATRKDRYGRSRDSISARGRATNLTRAAARMARVLSTIPPDEAGLRRFHLFRKDDRRKQREVEYESRSPVVQRSMYEVAELTAGDSSQAAESQAVPEPGALLLVALAACALLLARQRRR